MPHLCASTWWEVEVSADVSKLVDGVVTLLGVDRVEDVSEDIMGLKCTLSCHV